MSKRSTRESLLVAAMALFGERGYDATTTAEIARTAGVSEMTLFRHFPTKAALVVDDPYDPVIGERVAARPAGEGPLLATVRGVRDAWSAVPEPEAAAVRERLLIVARTPGLRTALASGSARTERAISDALESRGADSASARIAAAAAMAALNAALLHWAEFAPGSPLGEALSAAFRVLESGCPGC